MNRPALAKRRASQEPTIDELVGNMRRLDRVCASYAVVELDLRAHDAAPDLNLVSHHAARAAREFDQAKEAIKSFQAKCSHAFELIGEARPPFWQCVRCYATRSMEP